MYTNARVVSLEKDSTVLVGCSTEACSNCKAGMFCNNKKENTFLALNKKNLNLKSGDSVELYLPPKTTVLSTLLVFGLPLCLFPLGYVLFKLFISSNELINALGGLLLMALGFSVAAFISIRNRKSLMPVVNKVNLEE